MIDATHDPARRSWCESANGHPHFPLQNLPFGVFSSNDDGQPRGGIAIGEDVLDLAALAHSGLVDKDAANAARIASAATLNGFFAMGAAPRRTLRHAVSGLLSVDGPGSREAEAMSGMLLRRADACRMHLPVTIGDYTDFYAGIHHATNAGGLFRPDEPLLPNYRHVPIAYHGRASSVRLDDAALRRPRGQVLSEGTHLPRHEATARLDFEAELGIVIGKGSELGTPVRIGDAADHIAGYCLLNDWSARDIQAWEYRPLGPFTAKNFLTTISPWIVTPEALAPFRRPAFARDTDDPRTLRYLLDDTDQASGGLDCEVEVLLQTAQMRQRGLPPHRLTRTSTANLYWTVAQMIAHHTATGCDLRSGDLLGSGTISGTSAETLGSLMEMTHGGRDPLRLPTGEARRYLEDGDLIVLTARCNRDGFASIGFGDCRVRVEPVLASPDG
jgi:fumarylacetoacetase